jgi:hypothetical protein
MPVKCGIPFIVNLRKYLFHAIIVVFALIVDVILFQLLAEVATKSCAEIKRINDAPQSEIVYTGEPYGNESFYYLKQHHLYGNKKTNASCDILMLREGATYGENDIYFSGTLEEGTCAVSANLAKDYGLNVGDVAHFVGEEVEFKVTELLTPQAGLDKEYLREGIVVVAYNAELLNKNFSYLAFDTDGDAYPSLISLIFIKDWKAESVGSVLTYLAISLTAVVATIVVCECFLFRARRRDYRLLVDIGERRSRLFLIVWAENLLKYILPIGIMFAVYSANLACYGLMYALPVFCFLGGALILITAYSLVLSGRLYKCRARQKM